MDLTTTYMGLKLKTPLVPSASPLSESIDNIKKMEDLGAGAVVMFSIFEEQVKQEAASLDYFTEYGTESYAESLNFFPAMDEYSVGTDKYVELIAKATKAVDIPVIGSINGVTNDSWIEYGKKIEQAGAAGLELNLFYVPTNAAKSGAEIEAMKLDIVKAVKASVKIPVAVKLSPFFSSMAHMAQQFDKAGADALVLFNRFYQPDFDLDKLEVVSTLELSSPAEIRLALLWTSVLYGKVNASLAATTGVHSAQEVLKYIMAGSDVAMVASVLLKRGVGTIGTILNDLMAWMDEHEYASIAEMKGSMSQRSVENPSVFERANYIKMLKRFENPYLA